MLSDAEPAALETVTSIDGEAPGTGVRRLPFVDGVRGLAALIVLGGHMIIFTPLRNAPSRLWDAGPADIAVWPFRFGHEMVELFLLVSGFSLYYSELARRARGRAATTLSQFAARRAWRIAPVYYVALALGLVVTWFFRDHHIRWFPKDATFLQATPGGVISHLFFLHSFDPSWESQINLPLWSIAYEVQLYLLFPLLFFAMRRWNPWVVAVAVALAVQLVNEPHWGFPIFGLARWFVAGALLAELAHRRVRVPARISLPLGLAALFIGMAQFSFLSSDVRHDAVWLAAFVLLMFAALEYPEERRNPMSWRWMRWLGLRSYSLYALHFPIVLLLLYAAQSAHLSGWRAIGLVVGAGVPACLALAVVSFRFVEGPSLERVARVGRCAEHGDRSRPAERI